MPYVYVPYRGNYNYRPRYKGGFGRYPYRRTMYRSRVQGYRRPYYPRRRY